MIVLRGFRDFRDSAPFNIEDLVIFARRKSTSEQILSLLANNSQHKKNDRNTEELENTTERITRPIFKSMIF